MKRIYGWHVFGSMDLNIYYREVPEEFSKDDIDSMEGEWFFTFKEAKKELNRKINEKINDWREAKNYVKAFCIEDVAIDT